MVPERGQNRERERETRQRQTEKNNWAKKCHASRKYFYLVYWFGCVATAKWGRKALHKSEGELPGFLDDCRSLVFFFYLFT